MATVLVPTKGSPELLPPNTCPCDIFQRSSLFSYSLAQSATIFWTATSANGQELNEFGTRAIGCPVHGDICISFEHSLNEIALNSLLSNSQNWISMALQPSRCSHVQSEKCCPEIMLKSNQETRKAQCSCCPQSILEIYGSLHLTKYAKLMTPSETTAAAKLPSVAANVTVSDWANLDGNIFSCILKFICPSANDILNTSGVCSTWRNATFDDQNFLKSVDFKLNLQKPFKTNTMKLLSSDCDKIPNLLKKAMLVNNISALRCYGLMLDDVHLGYRSLGIWKRLFCLSDPYGCWKMGEILYEGRQYMPANQLNAFHALSRAAKKAMLLDDGPDKSLILSRVGIYLGYCFLDGDCNQKQDNETAIYWFQIAAQHGNEDAQRCCGWMFNTGMYG